MIYLSVSVIIKEGKMDEFLNACGKVRPLVLAEEGCLMYDHTLDLDLDAVPHGPVDERRVTLYEKWTGREALEAHLKTAHMADFSAAVTDLREEVTIRTGTGCFE